MKRMKRTGKMVIHTVIVCILLMSITGCNTNTTQSSESIYDLPESFWEVYAGDLSGEYNSDGVDKSSFQDNTHDYVNYHVQACVVIQSMYLYHNSRNENLLNRAKKTMSYMMGTFDEYGKFPRPEYKTQGYEYGWVSSMDSPVIMIGAWMLYEETGEDQYKEFVDKLSDYSVLNTRDGGFNYELGDGATWPLEYARESASEETNMYVLNGSLTGYVSLLGLNSVIKNKNIEEYLQSVERAYEAKFLEFHYANNEWLYYMLNKKTVIPVHYLIYETKLFNAICDLNEDDIFRNELEYRTALLKKTLRAEVYKNEDGSVSYFMLRAGIPNEYQIDCYSTRIEFIDSKGEVIETSENMITGSLSNNIEEFNEGMFLTGTIPMSVATDIEKYRVYSNNGAGWYLLFEDNVTTSELKQLKSEEIQITGVLDAVVDNKTFTIQKDLSEKVEADIVLTLNTKAEMGDYYLIELDNNMDIGEVSIGLKLYDSNREGATRYYTPLRRGKNLIVFDAIGFLDIENLDDIQSIWIRVYEPEDINGSIRVGSLYRTRSIKSLYEYIESTEYQIPPQ